MLPGGRGGGWTRLWRVGHTRVELDGSLVCRRGFLAETFRRVDPAEIQVCTGPERIERHRRAVCGERAVDVIVREMGVAKASVRLGVCRAPADCDGVRLDRLVGEALRLR